MSFTHTRWVNGGKSKEKQLELGHYMFEIAIYRALHERSNITAPFPEHLKFQEN